MLKRPTPGGRAAPLGPARSGAGGPPIIDEISVPLSEMTISAPAADVSADRSESEKRDKILRGWLRSAGVEEKYIEILFNETTTVSWMRVFTHHTKGYGAFNYELMEIIGDKILNMLTNMFIIDFKPTKVVSMVSDMHRVLTSNKTFGVFIEKRKLEDFLQIDGPITEKIKGDIFEAIVGNIAEILRKEINFPTAIYVLDKFVVWNLKTLEDKHFEAAKDPVQLMNDLFYPEGKRLSILSRGYTQDKIIVTMREDEKRAKYVFNSPFEISGKVPSFSSEIFDYVNMKEEKKKFAFQILAKLRDAGIVKADSLSVLKVDI